MTSHVRMVVHVAGRGLVPVLVPRRAVRRARARFGAEPIDCMVVEADGLTPANPCGAMFCGPFNLRSWHATVEQWREKARTAPLDNAQKVKLAELEVAWQREPSWWNAAPATMSQSVQRAIGFAQAFSCLAQQAIAPTTEPPPSEQPSKPDEPWWSLPSIPWPSLPKLPTFPTFGLPEWWPLAAAAVVLVLLMGDRRDRR